jgi:hypothetical protein
LKARKVPTMSVEITPLVWRTKLGNLTAKSILVLIGDQSNVEGFSYPSIEYISDRTEIRQRTVRRMIQIFSEINLLTKTDRGPRSTPGIQLNLARLEHDLREDFARQFRAAEGKTPSYSHGLRDHPQAVSETGKVVSETAEVVSETAPPHPHIGRTVREPLENRPSSPQRGHAEQTTLPLNPAIDSVMQACGFTSPKLRPVLLRVIQQEADKGEQPPNTALSMIAAWRRFALEDRLRYKWGARRFFEEGYWNKPDSWPWDTEAIQEQNRARAGSY